MTSLITTPTLNKKLLQAAVLNRSNLSVNDFSDFSTEVFPGFTEKVL